MGRRIAIAVFSGIIIISGSLAYAQNKALRRFILNIARKELFSLAQSRKIIDQLKEANQSADKSPEEIMALDGRWRTTRGVDDWINRFLTNPAAVFLREFITSSERKGRILYCEMFIFDKQGCIVATAEKATDYWQGDEEKFTKAFFNKMGEVFIDQPAFDESSLRYSIQVSLPVFDPETKGAIGVITAGIDLDVLAEIVLDQ